MGAGGVEQSKLVGGRYALEALLGKGGMGEVWRAKHTTLGSHVAIKFLSGASANKPSTRKRFLIEAQVAAQLKTRHAVQVFDFGITDEGQPYLVMELLDGETLGHRITRQTRLPVATTVRFLEQAARALERAHALGIVHRDFKPDNIVVVTDEEGREYVKVLDFGIAKLLNELDTESVDEDAPESVRPGKPFATFTKTGTLLGTPLYMAPEQVRNASDLDLRADIWAFGVVAFQCLTGVTPFEGRNLLQLFERVTSGEHPAARDLNPELPASFDEWFDIACAKDPKKRFASAKAAATQLAGALDAAQSSFVDTSSGENAEAMLDTLEAHAPTLDRRSDPSVSNVAHVSVTDSKALPPAAPRSRALLVAAAIALPLAAVAMWRVGSTPTPGQPVSISAPPPAPSPSAAPAPSPLPSATSAAPAPSPAPSPSVAKPIAASKPVASAVAAPAPSPSPAPAPAPTPSAVPPSPSPKPSAAPSATSSPFNLPPLGI